jgi:hypothetical protein
MSYGYLYCFSNESMPNILKIGMTERTPETRLSEANSSDTWRPPTPYKIEFAKKVLNPKQKESTIHMLLEQYTQKINPKREFFRVSVEEVKTFFDLMDGDGWIENKIQEEDEEDEEDKKSPIKYCRDIKKCFVNGQRIRHTIGINKTWIGIYNSSTNEIICNEKVYQGISPLNQFVKSHYKIERSDRVSNANAWSECEYEVNGKWISTYNIICENDINL